MPVKHINSAQEATYDAKDIGLIGAGGHEFTFAGFNDQGEVAGGVFSGDSYHTAVIRKSITQDFPTLPGYDASRAYAINNRGDVVGSSYKYVSAYWLRPTRACLWNARGEITDIGVLPGCTNSRARFINDKGQVVGHSFTPGTEQRDAISHAFLWDHHTMKEIHFPPHVRQSTALGINNREQIVGIIRVRGGEEHGFLWEHGTFTELKPLPGDTVSQATAINNVGQIIGISSDADLKREPHLILWENGKAVDLGSLSGAREIDPVAINDRGQIIFNARAGKGRQFTYLYEAKTGFQRIRNLVGVYSGYDFQKVLGLNNQRWILVGGQYHGGSLRCFILTPKQVLRGERSYD